MQVLLPPDLRDAILTAARAAYPRECCGLVEGVREGDLFRVVALHVARNLAGEDTRFEIDPRDHIAAVKSARANGRAVIGCYHSHPNGRAVPSQTDLAGAGEDGFLWLIAAGDAVAGFVHAGGVFQACDVTG